LGVAWLSSSERAAAQSAVDRTAAEALFAEGRRLMGQGQYAEACPKLEASQRMDPGVGTLFNLADCYAKQGRTASAWAAFREAGAAARAQGSAEREAVARERATALEPKLSHLTIVQWKGQNVAITRNGAPVDPGVLDTPIPVDPGSHVIVAAAEGKRQWSTTVEVGAGGERASVTIPILPDEAGGSSDADPDALSIGASGEPTHVEDSDPGATQRWLAVGAGAIGVIGLVAGTVFGIEAQSEWEDAQACDADPMCGEGGQLSQDASASADIATVAFVIGGVGIAGGLVLWLTAPEAESADGGAGVSVGVGLQGLLVRGSL
jgi:hypothetical protein